MLILYATAIVHENGEVFFYDDIYGHDASLDEVLSHGYPVFGIAAGGLHARKR